TVGVRPTPSARIPVVIGGGAEPAIRRAARLADGIFSNASAEDFCVQVQWALEECERAGRDPSTFRFIHYSILLPGASRADALARYRDAVWGLSWKYGDMEASATRPLPPVSPPPFQGPDERLLRGTAHAGTTDEIVETLLDIRKQAKVAVEFVARSHLPLLEYDAQLEVMEQLAEGVAPHL
ncbi:MAG TPA: LLM class flavin-dependent oxidoreductase, partial [Candidatus Limnocylindrales bacterium]|nr:LLM class flavin-dependent oxidoreductase [Candidatus Limnocylindrales bacterium]